MTTKKIRQITLLVQSIILLALFSIWLGGGFTTPVAALTVPTRTPVPPPGGGGGGGGGGGEGGGGGSSEPTAIPATNTPVPAVTLAPTPVDGFVTPEACGIPLFQASNGAVNVRERPSTTGDIVGRLVFLEARGISGRYNNEPWWRIVLADGTQGWVANATGTVFGNTGAVLILDEEGAIALEGGWRPTPNPVCPTLTPTVTPSATPTAEPTSTPTVTKEATATQESEAVNAAADPSTPTASPTLETVSALEEPTAEPASTPEAIAAADPALAVEDDSGGVNILLLGGMGLLLAGFAVFFAQRRGNGE